MEFADVTVKESPGLCRCCLSEGCYKDLGSEYSWMNDTEVYADMLLDCFDIGITQHNDGPNGPKRLICEVCITRLRDACNFKKQVVDSEKKFIDMLGRGEFRQTEKQTVLLPVYSGAAPLKAEAIEEVTVPDDFEDSHAEFLEDIDYTEDDELVKSEETVDPTPSSSTSKRGRPRKTESETPEKKPKLKAKAKIAKDMKPEGITKFTANECRRRNLQTLVNNTSVIPFKWRGKYLCYFCGIDKKNHHDLKEHTKTHIPCTTTERAMKLIRCGNETKVDVSEIICNICSEHLPNIDDLISHLKLKHKLWYHEDMSLTLVAYRLADLKCLVCSESFKIFCNLIRHMNHSHPDNCFQCDICSQKYNKMRDLSHHIRTYHKKDYSCPKCSLTFSCFQNLLKHKTKEHLSKCNICFQTFSSYEKRVSHMKKEHALDDGGECGFCHKQFFNKYSFLDHATKCKDSIPVEESTVVVDDENKNQNVKELRTSIANILNMTTAMPFKFFHNKFKCFYCPKDFTSCNDLRQHTTTEHPTCETTFQAMKLRGRSYGIKIKVDTSSLYCKICFQRFNDFTISIDHLETEHKTVLKKHVSIFQPFNLIHDKFGCPFCGEEFRYFSLLLQHVNTNHSDNQYICTFCGKSFNSDSNLRGHISYYHSIDKFKCNDCNQEFSSNNGLKVHMGNAHGKKVFNCQQCSEKFVSQYRMMRHTLKAHDSGHKCSYCGMAFIKYSFMINHVRRLHLKEKNVHCTLCNERFFDTNRLKMHMVRHVGERTFRCDYCGKRFLRKKNLKGHVALHLKDGSLVSQT